MTSWQSGRTFDGPYNGQGIDPASLAARKGSLRISVILPAKNEEATVGRMVAAIRRDLVENAPLVDELIVIDSDSTDSTAAVARAAGAEVYAAKDIETGMAPVPGKGEAIWRSLFVATGDVLVFLDADLTEWSTDYVSGLVLPFIENPHIVLSKGFYRRPAEGESGGGRVTELVARPMIALHRPVLAGIVQPIGGEWAVRRDAISAMALPSGYAVDLAVLMGVYDAKGTDGIAQVDLGIRAHMNQDLHALGIMSMQIIAYAERRSGLKPDFWLVPLRQYDPDTHEPIDRQVELVLRPAAHSLSVRSRRSESSSSPARAAEN